MAKNIFDTIETSDRGIFRDETVLSPEFVPDELPGREAESGEIAAAMKPATGGGRPASLFIYGPAGTGKTAACRMVTAQLKEYSEKPLVLYVNCWQVSTRQSILSALAAAAGDVVPRRGVATDEVFGRTMQIIRNTKRVPIVVLDEADRLFSGGEEEVLYDLSRSHETYGVPTGVMIITNDSGLLAKAESRIRSSLAARQLEFKPYAPAEIKAILAKRAARAFVPGACGDEVIALCAAFGAKNNGDCRISIQALYQAGRLASRKGATAISVEDCREALAKIVPSADIKRERDEAILPESVHDALAIIRENGGPMPMSAFYEKFCARTGASERTARNYVRELELKNLVYCTEERGPMGERRRTIVLK